MRLLPVFLLALVVAACASQSPTPSDNFYRLSAPQPEETLGAPLIDGVITVGLFRTDGLHSERAIIYTEDPQSLALQQYHYHYWLDTPPRMLQEYLVSYLRAANAAPMVATEGDVPAAMMITGRLKRLERLGSGGTSKVAIALELQVRRSGQQRPVLMRVYEVELAAPGDTVHAAVLAFSEGLDQLFADFLADLRAVSA